jgi:hypothetical protein
MTTGSSDSRDAVGLHPSVGTERPSRWRFAAAVFMLGVALICGGYGMYSMVPPAVTTVVAYPQLEEIVSSTWLTAWALGTLVALTIPRQSPLNKRRRQLAVLMSMANLMILVLMQL